MTEFAFFQKFYGSLALLILAFWGMGQTALSLLKAPAQNDRWLQGALATSLGMGLFVVVLQGLAVGGQLTRPALFVALIVSWGLALWQTVRAWRQRAATGRPATAVTWQAHELFWLWVVLVALAPTLVAPLTPPQQWDELMYHLPHARQWAMSGSLTVNEWLRFPWFPYNYDLLYAAALLLKGDVLAHLLHALAGWLVALITYRVGVRHAGHATAGLATSAWLVLGGPLYASAYIDLGVALFLMSSAVALWLWLQDREQLAWLVAAAFALGLAAGSKYQALIYLPFFGAVLLWFDRRPKTWAAVALAFLLPCAYWYVRNAIQTGDPFDPLGARVFGYHDWNEWDLTAQFNDLKGVANWPPKCLWPALLAPLIPRFYRTPIWRGVMLLAAYASTVWLFTSHYDRYLLPMFPLLALLSARVVLDGSQWVWRWRPHWVLEPRWVAQQLGLLLALAAVLVLGLYGWNTSEKAFNTVAFTSEQRDAMLTQALPAYPLVQKLHQPPGRRIYQFALENLTYYAPNPIWGEIFGPWRNHDRMSLGAKGLALRLRAEGFDTLLIRNDVLGLFQHDADFDQYFRSIDKAPGAEAFDILTP